MVSGLDYQGLENPVMNEDRETHISMGLVANKTDAIHAYALGHMQGRGRGRKEGQRNGFYKGLAWIIPTAIGSLLLGYGFARMSTTSSERRDTPSALEVSSNPSEK